MINIVLSIESIYYQTTCKTEFQTNSKFTMVIHFFNVVSTNIPSILIAVGVQNRTWAC